MPTPRPAITPLSSTFSPNVGITRRSAYSWLCRRRHNHDLRHSYATGALKAGVSPKVLSERIGHANVGFFLQTYAHVLRNDDRDAAEQRPRSSSATGGIYPKKARRA